MRVLIYFFMLVYVLAGGHGRFTDALTSNLISPSATVREGWWTTFRRSTALPYANDEYAVTTSMPSRPSIRYNNNNTLFSTNVTTPGKVNNKHEIAWSQHYQELLQFYKKHGHANVPYTYPPNPKLSRFVTNQRHNYKAKLPSMTLERVSALNDLNFTWDTRSSSVVSSSIARQSKETKTEWREKYGELVQYKQQHGDHVDLDIPPTTDLGKWVQTQKQNYKLYCQGLQVPMTEKRLAALVSIGLFECVDVNDNFKKYNVSVGNKFEEAWFGRYRDLLDFYARNNHTSVPTRDGGKLGRWVDTQRTAYRLRQKGKPSPMTLQRIRLLEDVNFVWDPTELQWRERFEELKQYQMNHKSLAVVSKWNTQLYTWVKNQRAQYKLYRTNRTTTITKSRIEALNEIGFEWEDDYEGDIVTSRKKKTPWLVRFRQLTRFKKRHGHCVVPQNDEENPELGSGSRLKDDSTS